MENYPSSMSYTKSKNKLKLFGADIGFSQAREPENEYYAVEDDGASLNSSSSTMSGSSPSPSPSPPEKKKKKKYECKWCFKVLANSQALGGHQNAHKKERMMRKIQLQASRAAGFGYYVDQSLSAQDYCYSYGSNEAWAPDHRQISFGSGGDHDDGYFCGSDVTFQGEDRGHGFSLTHAAADNASNYHGHLDLQLGLGL